MKRILAIIVLTAMVGSIQAEQPEAEDISKNTEADGKSEEAKPEEKESVKVEQYRYPWEKTPEAWNAAMSIVQSKLRRKYPVDDRVSKQGFNVWYRNEISIEAVKNITPPELNTPDYDGQGVQGSIAVFIVPVKIRKIATASGGVMNAWQTFQGNLQRLGVPNMAPAQLSQNSVQPGKVLDEDEDYFLVSVPERPFSRMGINNPMGNPISQAVMTTALGTESIKAPPKMNHIMHKILFPSEKPMFLELKKSDLENLQAGNPSKRLMEQAMKNYPYAMYNPQIQSMLKEFQSSGLEKDN